MPHIEQRESEMNAKYKIGDHVLSQSGLVYKISYVRELDDWGSRAYGLRRWRGGKLYGPFRLIAECNLFPIKTTGE
jgi:hypothetical protein